MYFSIKTYAVNGGVRILYISSRLVGYYTRKSSSPGITVLINKIKKGKNNKGFSLIVFILMWMKKKVIKYNYNQVIQIKIYYFSFVGNEKIVDIYSFQNDDEIILNQKILI